MWKEDKKAYLCDRGNGKLIEWFYNPKSSQYSKLEYCEDFLRYESSIEKISGRLWNKDSVCEMNSP